MPHPFLWWLNPPPPPYIIQRHAGLVLLGFGIIGLFFPATRNAMQLPELMEWMLFVSDVVVGLVLLRVRNLRMLDRWIVAACMLCGANAAAWTMAIGVNTATWVYGLEIYFLIRLLGKVRADQELRTTHGS